MIKKIIAILLIFSMLPFCVYAQDLTDEKDYKLETLCGLDILSTEYKDSYSARDKVTYKDYLGAVVGFMSEEEQKDLLEYARRFSLIRYNESINLSDYISFIDAVKILVRAGGYSEHIPDGESYSMYRSEASDRKLLKGIIDKQDSHLTSEDFVALLYNAIDAHVVDYNYVRNGIEKEVHSDETIISRYRDIYEYDGILEDNGQTSLSKPLPTNDEFVVVDGEIFEVNDMEVIDYLGMRVKLYYKDNDGDYILQYVLPEKNKVLEMLTDDVSVDPDFSRLTYYENDGTKSRTAKLDAALKVIFNGELYYDYTADDFTGINGRMKLIDNNEDGKYDVVVIDKFQTVVASYVTGYDSKLVNKYTYSGALTGIELDNEDEDIQVNFYIDNQLVQEPVINEWAILSIAESANGGRIKKILISESRETGTLDSISETEGYGINGDLYKLNQAFIDAITASDVMVPEIMFGTEYMIFFDAFGKIAALRKAENTALQYVVMMKLRQDDFDEETVTLKYMDSVGEWHTKPLRKKVRIYNDIYNGRSLKASDVFTALTDANRKVVPQVIQMSLNDDGEVNAIKIAVKTNAYEKDKLTVRNEVSGAYRWTTKMLGSVNGPQLYFANNTTIFVFPSGISYDENDYSVQSVFETDKDYSVIPYNVDEFMTTDCVVIKGTETGTEQQSLFIVDKVTQMLNSDNEVVDIIVGQFGDYSGFSVMAKNDDVFSGLQKGDVLKLHTDNRSRVINKDVIFSASRGKQTQMTVDYSGLAAGYVTKVDPSTKSIVMNCGSGTFAFKAAETQYKLTTYLNDANERKSQVVDFSDIMVGDFIIANIHFATLKDVIIIRNYQ